jgi:YggT family protein
MSILGDLITLYTVVLLLRVVMSWFPPVLAPIRRTLPPMGGLDLSPMLLLIALQILGRALA